MCSAGGRGRTPEIAARSFWLIRHPDPYEYSWPWHTRRAKAKHGWARWAVCNSWSMVPALQGICRRKLSGRYKKSTWVTSQSSRSGHRAGLNIQVPTCHFFTCWPISNIWAGMKALKNGNPFVSEKEGIGIVRNRALTVSVPRCCPESCQGSRWGSGWKISPSTGEATQWSPTHSPRELSLRCGVTTADENSHPAVSIRWVKQCSSWGNLGSAISARGFPFGFFVHSLGLRGPDTSFWSSPCDIHIFP